MTATALAALEGHVEDPSGGGFPSGGVAVGAQHWWLCCLGVDRRSVSGSERDAGGGDGGQVDAGGCGVGVEGEGVEGAFDYDQIVAGRWLGRWVW